MKKLFSFFLTILLCFSILPITSCKGGSSENAKNQDQNASFEECEVIPLKYANQFAVERYGSGAEKVLVLRIEDGLNYIVLPEGVEPPSTIGGSDTSKYTIINQPLDSVYLAASSVMDLISAMDSGADLSHVKLTSTKASDWGIPEIKEMVDNGEIAYVGKYNAPDYEALLETECDLAVGWSPCTQAFLMQSNKVKN